MCKALGINRRLLDVRTTYSGSYISLQGYAKELQKFIEKLGNHDSKVRTDSKVKFQNYDNHGGD